MNYGVETLGPHRRLCEQFDRLAGRQAGRQLDPCGRDGFARAPLLPLLLLLLLPSPRRYVHGFPGGEATLDSQCQPVRVRGCGLLLGFGAEEEEISCMCVRVAAADHPRDVVFQEGCLVMREHIAVCSVLRRASVWADWPAWVAVSTELLQYNRTRAQMRLWPPGAVVNELYTGTSQRFQSSECWLTLNRYNLAC